MSEEKFTEAIANLTGLPKEMREELLALAPALTDEQRAKAIEDLTPLAAQMQEGVDTMRAGSAKLKELVQLSQHKYVPKLRKAEEAQSKAEELEDIETIFDENT